MVYPTFPMPALCPCIFLSRVEEEEELAVPEEGGLAAGCWAASFLHRSPGTGAAAALHEPTAVPPDRCPAARATFSAATAWSRACLPAAAPSF